MTDTIRVAYLGRRLDGKGRLFHLYDRLDDQDAILGDTLGFTKPLHPAQRPGTILAVQPAGDGKWYTSGERGPVILGAVQDERAAAWDATDRATWITQQRKRADVAKAAEAADLRSYLAPIHDAYVGLPAQARTAFLADVMDAIMQPRWGR